MNLLQLIRWLRRLPQSFALALTLTALLSGCASIKPGNDPLVVNVERAETIAKSTFDLVLNVDHTDREFWKAKAPAFHDFCNWLRQPQIVTPGPFTFGEFSNWLSD